MARTIRARRVVVALAIALIGAACSDDAEPNAAEDESAEQTGGGTGEGLLAEVQDRGTLNCGVNNAVPGFGVVDEAGDYSGFDIDFCRVIAAAVLGDAEAVEYVPLTAEQRFTSLASGEIDVLVRNTTWTASRDGTENAAFAATTFYDGQGMMVTADSGIASLDDMDGATVCVLSGTTTEQNLATVFNARRPQLRAAAPSTRWTRSERRSSRANATGGPRTAPSWRGSDQRGPRRRVGPMGW